MLIHGKFLPGATSKQTLYITFRGMTSWTTCGNIKYDIHEEVHMRRASWFVR